MPRTELAESDVPLCERHDVALLDLDGVVYLGAQVVPGVPGALAAARERGMRLAFVTNNAARPAREVAARLTGLGIPADTHEVITSSQAAAHYLADRLPAGSAVLVVGTTGLIEALAERGLRPVVSADEQPAAVVQGYSPTLSWPQLAEGAVAILAGVPWVATNLDRTVPSPRGPLPGNGSMVAALRHATGAEPVSTGKPDPVMHRESVQRSGARRPLVVGDRLDTDIEGAARAGCPSLLVLTGVTGAAELLAAQPRWRPDYVGRDVSALLSAHPATSSDGRSRSCGSWTASPRDDGAIELFGGTASPGGATGSPGSPGSPDVPGDGLDGLRALCAAAWSAGVAQPAVRAGDQPAERLIAELGLA